jgi:uncharacterized protein (TIGR02687 family)
MANIDYELAKKELESKFKDQDYRIIFWYDETKSFYDDVKNDKFNNVKTIIFDKNEFEIKYLIEVEDKTSNLLIYFPIGRPQDKDNWLLDILIYSYEYYADEVALTMRKLGLTNPYLRKVIDRHAKFYKNQNRIDDLKKLVNINDSISESDLIHGMIAVLVKSKFIQIKEILIELIFDVVNTPAGEYISPKFQEIKNFGFEEFLWNQIYSYTNYSGDPYIESLVKKYMMTSFAKTAKIESFPSFYKQFIIDSSNQASNDALLLIDNIKTDPRYLSLQETFCESLKIQELISTRGIDDLGNSDVFELFDKFIVKTIFQNLISGSLDYDFFQNIILNDRINSFWFEKHKNEYEAILEIINFKKSLDFPLFDNEVSEEYIKLYTEKLYQVDLHYRHVIFYLYRIEENDEIIKIIKDKINRSYETHLDSLGSFFSKSLEKKMKWEFIGEKLLTEFYKDIQINLPKKMFVIISDAFRYEVASELHERIKTDPILKGTNSLDYFISPIPSITKVGMASLLPNKKIKYGTDVLVDGESTLGIKSRYKILFERNETYSAIKFDDILRMTKQEIREYMKDKSLVYIYHDRIDNAGEHKESEVFEASNKAIEEILTLIKKLYNTLQISNFIVTADHGFLYRDLKVDDSLKYNEISKIKPVELSRRYAIINDQSTVPYTLRFSLDYLGEDNPSVITPYSYDYFKSPGGIQYVHGGSSLQEIIVPCLKISELRSGSLKETIGPVGVRIKSVIRSIKERSFIIEFEQIEKVADKKSDRKLITYFINDKNQDVSGRYTFIANSDSDDLNQRITRVRFTLNNIEFNRDKPCMLVLKDDNQSENEYIEKVVFKIDILGFKAIF